MRVRIDSLRARLSLSWLSPTTGLLFILVMILGGLVVVRLSGKQVRRFGWVEIGDQRYRVVYAISPADRQQGLSGRSAIGADGMAFINPQSERSLFWMYQMQFPLDFVWVSEGKVVDLHEQVPAPGPSGEIVRLVPRQAVDMVIEFPSGTIGREKITIGTPVKRVLNWYFSLW